MKTYFVFVESSDNFTIEAESPEDAIAQAQELAATHSQPNEWDVEILDVEEEGENVD